MNTLKKEKLNQLFKDIKTAFNMLIWGIVTWSTPPAESMEEFAKGTKIISLFVGILLLILAIIGFSGSFKSIINMDKAAIAVFLIFGVLFLLFGLKFNWPSKTKE